MINSIPQGSTTTNPELLAAELRSITSSTPNGIGDVSVVADLLAGIALQHENDISEAAAADIVEALSSLASADLDTEDTESAADICEKLV